MALRLYDTIARTKDFAPLEDNLAKLYTCGPTVYNFAHIGNLRTYVSEDILKRTLRFCGFGTRHVMNVTDVGHLTSDADAGEDKMALGAAREGKTVWEIAQFYWDAFQADIARLNILPPDIWCRATDHIAEQIEMVRQLEEKGFTYVIADGVYFDTGKLRDYGRLARLDVAGLQAGHRVELVEGKRNPTDFALWKFSPPGSKRLMEWPSPWGVGFPGWHLECSAMSLKYLGPRLDIHCGGIDHIPVHHTNEIAQTESVTGQPWVNFWVHGEFLVMAKAGGEAAKMAKSAGEFLTLDVLIKKGYDPPAYRYFCLTAHYRQQLSFTFEGLDAAANAYAKLKRQVLDLRGAQRADAAPLPTHLDAFRAAVEDDLNMPRTLAALWGLLAAAPADKAAVYATLLEMDKVLGLGVAEMKEDQLGADAAEIEQLIAARAAARKARDFKRADELRKELAARGITLEDSPTGTTWRRS